MIDEELNRRRLLSAVAIIFASALTPWKEGTNMSGFADAIVGGQGNLIRQMIRSPNYVPGSAGWTINKDGSAEFNNLVLRGVFDGTDFIIDSDGAFFYDGTPANGNLIASIASASGTDSFGNAFLKGIAVYNTSTGSTLELLSNTITLDNPGDAGPASIAIATVQSGPDAMQMKSPVINLSDVQAFLALVRGDTGTHGMAYLANSVLNIASSFNTLNTPTNGFSLYSDFDGRIPAYIESSGLHMGLSGSQLAFFPGNTVTQASLTNLASTNYRGNNAQPGAVYELEVNGNGTWGSTGQTLELAAVFGGNTMANITLGANYMATSTNFRWKARIRAICHSIGVGGTWSSEIEGHCSVFGASLLSSSGGSANATNSFFSCESTGTTVVDTTVNELLSLQAAWGSTTGAPTLTSRVAMFKRIA